MKKIYLSAITSILVVLVVIVSVMLFNFNFNASYQIETAGYTYDSNDELLNFSSSAKYQKQGLQNDSTIVEDGVSTGINSGRLLFLENGRVEVLENAVGIIDKNQIADINSKSFITATNQTFNISKTGQEGDGQQVPQGTIVKLNEGKYLVLDQVTLQNDKEYSKKIPTNMVFVSIDENSKVRILTDGKYEETISDQMYLSMENSFCKFYLTSETLDCLDSTKNIDLKNIIVNFDDKANKRDDKKQTTTANNETSTSPVEASQTNEGGTNKGSGENVELPPIEKIGEGDYTIPRVNVFADAQQNTISGTIKVSTADTGLTALAVSLYNQENQLVQKEQLDVSQKEFAFNFSNLTYNQEYQITVDGSYKNKENTDITAMFYRKNFYLNPVTLIGKIESRTANSLNISLVNENERIESITIGYQKNDGRTTDKGSVTVQSLEKQQAKELEITGLASNNSYVISIEEIVIQGVKTTNPKWYLIGNTLKELPTATKTIATVNGTTNMFNLNLEHLSDVDESLTYLRYVGYLATDYAENGRSAKEYVSATKSEQDKFQAALLPKTIDMVSGSYIFVAYLTGFDGQDPYEIIVPPSEIIEIATAKRTPTVEFSLQNATQNQLDIQYQIQDIDSTINYSLNHQPVMSLYEVDETGNTIGEPIKQKSIQNPSELSGALLFTGLKADTNYRVNLQLNCDIADGNGDIALLLQSDVYKTKAVMPITATFKEVEILADEIAVNVELPADSETLIRGNIKIYEVISDTNQTLVEVKNIDTDLVRLKESGGKNFIFENLKAETTYRIVIEDAHDSGDNFVPVTGEFIAVTTEIKEMPTAEFQLNAATATSLRIDYTVSDQDAAILFSGHNLPVMELYEVYPNGSTSTTPVATQTMTEANLFGGQLNYHGLKKLTNYRVVLKASYDLKDSQKVQIMKEISISEKYQTTDVEVVEAFYQVAPTDITPTAININVQLSSYAQYLKTGKLAIYEQYSATAITTVDLTPDFLKLVMTGKNYQFTELVPNTTYTIKLEETTDGINNITIINPEYTFTTKAVKTRPTAAFRWDKVNSGANSLVLDYQITDPDTALDYSITKNPTVTLYTVDANGNPLTEVSATALTTPTTTGTVTYTALAPSTEYIAVMRGSYNDGIEYVENIILGTSEVMRTTDPATIFAEFLATSVETQQVNYSLKLLNNQVGLANGQAAIQFYQYGTMNPTGTSHLLTAAEISALANGLSINLVQTDLTAGTRYIARFVDSKDSANTPLTIEGELDVTTLKNKVKATILFSNVATTSSTIGADFEVMDVDNTLQVSTAVKAKMQLYTVNQNDEIVALITEKEYTSLEQLRTGHLDFTKLATQQKYRIVLTAYYDLADGSGIKLGEIGSVDAVTTNIDPIEANFELIPASTNTTEALLNLHFSSHPLTLTTGKLQVYQTANNQPIGTAIDLSMDFSFLNTMVGKNYVLNETTIGTNLNPNTEYIVKVIGVKDDGNNDVTVLNALTFKTRARQPLTDKVLSRTELSVAGTTQIGGLIGQLPQQLFSDSDNAIQSITYSIFDSSDLTQAIKSIVVTDPTKFQTYTYFDLSDDDLGKGRTYTIKANVHWNDNYDDHVITDLVSDPMSIAKEEASVTYEIISRNATETVLKVRVKDTDKSIVDGTSSLKTDVPAVVNKPLVIGENLITVPTNPGVTQYFETTADIEVLTGSATTKSLLNMTLQPVNSTVSSANGAVSYRASDYSLVMTTTPQDNQTKQNSIFATYTLKNDETASVLYTSKKAGSTLFSEQKIKLPTEDLLFDHTYNLTLDIETTYRENKITQQFTQPIILGLAGSEQAIGVSSNYLGVTSVTNNIATYEVISSSYDAATGNLTNVVLKNTNTGAFIKMTNNRIVEDSNTPANLTFILQPDGSYVMTIDGKNIDLAAGTTTVNSGTKINMYTAAAAQTTTTEVATVSPLGTPTFEAKNIEIYDTRIVFDYAGTDVDNTLVKNPTNTGYNTKILLTNLDTNQKQEYPITLLSKTGIAFTTLYSNTPYSLEIIGDYNLFDGQPIKTDHVFYSTTFTTQITLPTVVSSSYTWNPDVCGIPGTSSKLVYTDAGNVATNIRYVWYQKPAGTYDKKNLIAMNELLKTLTPVKTFTYSKNENPSSATVNLAMMTGNTVNYPAGNYIVAVYMDTNITETPTVLGNVEDVSIKQPTLPSTTWQTLSLNETESQIRFNYNDTKNVLGCGDKKFVYQLFKVNPNGTEEAVGLVTPFTKTGVTGQWDQRFTNLTPNTNYRLYLTSTSYNDLVTIGQKKYSYDFKTLDQYVTSPSLTINYGANKVTTGVVNLKPGNSTITSIKFELYQWKNQGTVGEEKVLKQTNVMTIPGTYPAALQTDFLVTGYDPDLYFTKLIVTYRTASGNDGTYEITSYPVYTAPTGRSAFSSVYSTVDELVISDAIDERVDTIRLTDEVKEITTITDVQEKIEADSLTIPLATHDNVYTIESYDTEGQLLDIYSSNGLLPVAYISQYAEKTRISSTHFINDMEEITITVTKKDTFFDAIIHLFTEPEHSIIKTTKDSLKDGIVIDAKINDVEITITDSEGQAIKVQYLLDEQ